MAVSTRFRSRALIFSLALAAVVGGAVYWRTRPPSAPTSPKIESALKSELDLIRNAHEPLTADDLAVLFAPTENRRNLAPLWSIATGTINPAAFKKSAQG